MNAIRTANHPAAPNNKSNKYPEVQNGIEQALLTELRRLKQRVETEIKEARRLRKARPVEKMQRLAADHGMTLDEVVGKLASPVMKWRASWCPVAQLQGRPQTGKVAPKYRHPEMADIG